MTSFIIDDHRGRQIASAWKKDPYCPFCRIINGELPAFRVFENDEVIAILDILPLRRGHTLVIPKTHYSRLSELPPGFAAAVGATVSLVAHALTQALDNTALNVVCNQEYAQAVPHVHYHIVPAPQFNSQSTEAQESEQPTQSRSRNLLTVMEMHQREFESRQELDDEEGEALAMKIRARL